MHSGRVCILAQLEEGWVDSFKFQLQQSSGPLGSVSLMTVPSVEAERAFSAAGILCTKLRSRLDDRTLDTLCFLQVDQAVASRAVFVIVSGSDGRADGNAFAAS